MQSNFKIKGLFLTLLFTTLLYSKNFSQSIYKKSSDKYWHTLLHFKNGKSEIDSTSFFLNQNGKNNTYLELNTTIANLIHPVKNDDNSTYCRFPARRIWIEKNFKNISIKKQTCTILEKEFETIKNINKITLIFPTTHINSPASMFGHTLLRLDNSNNDLLTSYAINYAATTNEDNGFIYAWKGLTGGYKGKYSIVPYYKKINEYSNMENRDIWEYELNLSKSEIKNLLYHLFEVKHEWSEYYYFNHNCSYEILWLLQAARNDLFLVNSFNYKTLPIDTIKEIYNKNIITKHTFRPSKRKFLLKYYNEIKNKELALTFYNITDIKLLNNINISEQRNILNFSLELIRYDKSKNKISKDKYLSKLIKLLKYRSTLGLDSKLNIKKPINPIYGHNTNRLSFKYYKDNIEFGIKPSFHGMDDLDYGFINGAYIDFLKIDVKYNKNKEVALKNISLFNIKSYAARNDIFKPISWGIDFGNEQFINEENYTKLKTSVGFTYGYGEFLNSLLIINNVRQKDKLYYSYGINYFAQFSLNNSKNKFIIDTQVEKFSFGKYNLYDVSYIQNVFKNVNLKIGIKKELDSKYTYINLLYYFK